MSKTIIVSNRLPIKIIEDDGKIHLKQSEGGLATGLSSIYKHGDNIWIGWPGETICDQNRQQDVVNLLDKENLYPVFLSEDEIENYYEGFSNEVLWPVFHYMTTYAQFENRYWKYYQEVNEKFKQAILEKIEPGDTLWIHDYQLLLLPKMIRDEIPDVSIGFFQHIPFPSYEIFRLIPWREELLCGMLGADLVGFHTYDDVRHFISASARLLHLAASSNRLQKGGREISVDAFPMGIDAQKFESMKKGRATKGFYKELIKNYKGQKVILSIDRLDYSKGILQRLHAFERILENHPEYIEKIVLYMVVVPSRDTIAQYKELRDEVDKLSGNINARFRTESWHPVQYFYRSFPMEHIVAVYSRADICVVTPMRDGMNLVSKEYIASRRKPDGLLILSEMAGASKELSEAIIVNPNNQDEIYGAMLQALETSLSEQRERMSALIKTVEKFDVYHWVKVFMTQLAQIKQAQKENETRKINSHIKASIIEEKDKATRRVFFLDYDGTLVGFKPDINRASPDKELYKLLQQLNADERNLIVIISGRQQQTLENWFGHLPIDLIAEHGAWIKTQSDGWQQTITTLANSWKEDVRPMLEAYSDRTPGAFIEEKNFSLAWHYRKADADLGALRATELGNNLSYLTRDKGLQILSGNKVLEIRSSDVNKGKAALAYLSQNPADFIFTIGDDTTDEDTFQALITHATTVKVGSGITAAHYYVKDVADARSLLQDLA